MMLARCTGLVAIPDELDAIEAAPILCAGLATFNALKKCGAEAGDLSATTFARWWFVRLAQGNDAA